jgi:hypothetical protein
LGGARIRKTISKRVYIEKKKNLFLNQQANFNQLLTNHPWMKKIKIVQIKGQVLIKGEIIPKLQKWGEVIEKFSTREPLIQNSSNLHESFLT